MNQIEHHNFEISERTRKQFIATRRGLHTSGKLTTESHGLSFEMYKEIAAVCTRLTGGRIVPSVQIINKHLGKF